MPLPKAGAIQLGLRDKGRAIKELVVRDIERMAPLNFS